MKEGGSKEKQLMNAHARDHMANERTFLAWIRTSIGIMAFGFVFEKFALLMDRLTLLLDKNGLLESSRLALPSPKLASNFGIIFVGFGLLICLFAFIQFHRVEKLIQSDSYRPSHLLNTTLALFVLAIGAILLIYLSHSIHFNS